jgi:arylsulfatase A-like enzyme
MRRWAILVPLAFATGSVAAPLNVVVILADDLGAHDLGYTGNPYHESPHIDQFAKEGVRFTQAYASAPVCSPTRAALMTGKHPARLHITIWAEAAVSGQPGRRKLKSAASEHNLPHTEVTLAKRLRDAGYATACIGKWHLGDAEHYPETHGFDINRGGSLWGAPQTYFWPYRGSGRFGQQYRYLPGLDYGKPGEYLTDRLTDEAIAFVNQATAAGKPFFLYLAHHAVHTPIEAKPADVEHFRSKLKPDSPWKNPAYAAMVKSLDDSVGRVLAELQQRGLADKTVVVFTSDNGGYIGKDRGTPVTTNVPLRSGKGSLYEGGVRVPLAIRWPGRTKPGESREPVVTADLLPTLLLAAGLKPDPKVPLDGTDLGSLLTNPAASLGRDALYWHYPHYYETTTPVGSIRAGRWKLMEYFEDGRRELYDLDADLSEKTDLAAMAPDRVRELQAKMVGWRNQVGAAMPTPNPASRGGTH